MVSKNQKKLIRSLLQKKYRKQKGLFVAEGKKVISELFDAGMRLHTIFGLDPELFSAKVPAFEVISEVDLKTISFLTTPQQALAIFHIPEQAEIKTDELIVALDDVRDPGNLGTIIRLCDWFGVSNLICSEQTVDCYNPKVVQATMGSIARVSVTYLHLNQYLKEKVSKNIPVYGTFMQGNTIYTESLVSKGIIVFGNEANGISPEVASLITHQITIPRFGKQQATESLNVATATAIVLSEFQRRTFQK